MKHIKKYRMLLMVAGLQLNNLQAAQGNLQSTSNTYQLPQGISNNYYDVIHKVLDDVGKQGKKPEVKIGALATENSLLLLINPYLSHMISQYIPEQAIENQLNNYTNAIKNHDMQTFKESLGLLEIYNRPYA